ncbi:MAG: HlyD family type I secretion periplasmic adaptor subunit [Hyphomicrobiaceae bacterium]
MTPANPNATDLGKNGQFSIARHVIFASTTLAVLVFGVGGWAATAMIGGAVIAPGTFVVERNVKKVQHSYGGIVSEIAVKNGDRVEGGSVLLRFDATQIRAELGVIRSQVLEMSARAVRLTAERDGRTRLVFSDEFMARGADALAAAEGETRLFDETRRAKDSQKEQLRHKIEQSKEEIIGLTGQKDAKAGEITIIKKELDSVRGLHEKHLTPVTRVYAMERETMRLGGEHGGLLAQIARARSQISEVEVQILAIDENVRAQAQRELRAIEAKLAELAEREIATTDKLRRIDIRAPQKGIVHELSVHTIGGVVTAAEQIMLIVPEEENLTVQARIAPNDIDQIAIGRSARLRLTAFAQQKTPELDARVVHMSADVTTDPKTGQAHYVVRLEMDDKARRTIADLKLVPGMPVEVYMATGDRTALSYLAKPFADQMNRAFRE